MNLHLAKGTMKMLQELAEAAGCTPTQWVTTAVKDSYSGFRLMQGGLRERMIQRLNEQIRGLADEHTRKDASAS